MATIDKKRGQIKDRAAGYKPLCYCVGGKTIKMLQACLAAHEKIMGTLPPKARASITSQEAKSAVLAYVALDDTSKKEFLNRIIMSSYGASQNEASAERLAEIWLEQKIASGITGHLLKSKVLHKRIFCDFFKAQKIKTTADLNPDTAHEFLKWRSETSYSRKEKISAKTIRQNLQELKQMAKIAYRHGWIANSGMWEDVEVKSIAGVNMKVVEALPVALQKEILAHLRKSKQLWQHDVFLFMLITGIRVGELRQFEKNGIENNALTLHGKGVGIFKSATGKSASAARTLPVCPTIIKIFERGNIFGIKPESFCEFLKRYSFGRKFPGVHSHRIRHSFAVNKLLSQTATLQMVSYQLGHKDIAITANLYGKFVPEHFKAGFEAAIKERRELVEWLENGYFD